MLDLAKYQLDIGLFTNQRDEMLSFWQGLPGVAYEGPLSVGGGVQQHRHQLRGSIIKVNHAREEIPRVPPAGYTEVLIADPERDAPEATRDPEGTKVWRVPPGYRGISQMAVTTRVRNLEAHKAFWGDVLGLPPAPRSGDDAFRIGDSVVFLEQDDDAPADAAMQGPGFRYLTLQVWDADAAHAGVLERGGMEGRPAITHGTVARYSFVRDPDGNWIELSQRGSLTGPVA